MITLTVRYGSTTSDEKETVLDISEITVPKIFLKIAILELESTEYNRDGKYKFKISRQQAEFSYSLDGEQYSAVYRCATAPGNWTGEKFGLFCCHRGPGDGGCLSVSDFVVR